MSTSALSTIDIMLSENPEGPKNDVLNELKNRLLENHKMKILDDYRLDKITVQFKKSIFEDYFVEKGMKADLVMVDKGDHFYHLHFNFEPYFEHNKQFMIDAYYPNNNTRELPEKELYNALEAGMYSHKLEVCLGDFEMFSEEQHEAMAHEHMIVI